MKEGWEYKKLGDVAIIINGFAFKSSLFTKEGEKILRISNIQNDIVDLSDVVFFNKETYKQNLDKYKVYPDDILIALSGATTGKIGINKTNETLYLNQRVAICRESVKTLNHKYLYCFLKTKSLEFLKDAEGVAQPNLSTEQMKNYVLPIPPLSEQQHIVEELDLLSSIIEKKKAQLNELDNLAQSLFYEMFGDPITNDKGWEVKIIGDCFSYIKNGANIKQTKGASGYPITRIETLSNGVFNRDRLGYANICDLTKYTNYVLNDGDLLMSHINSKAYIGRTVMYKKEDEEQIIHGMNLLRLVVVYDLLIPTFADYYFKTEYFKDEVAKIRKDAVNQSSMAIGDLRMIRIFLPPLALQQQFASNIEAIEHQKELIKQSIKEVETLYNSRMDFWFN